MVIRGNDIVQHGYSGSQDAAVLLILDGGGFSAPVVDDNFLSGGGLVLRLEDGCRDATVTGNDFGPLDGGFAEVDVDPGASLALWSGNRTSTGRLIPRP